MAYRTTPEDTDRLPSGLPYIIGNEAAERFSFYGMKAILTIFMTTYRMSGFTTPPDEPATDTFANMSEVKAKDVLLGLDDSEAAEVVAASGVDPLAEVEVEDGADPPTLEDISGENAKAVLAGLDADAATALIASLDEAERRELYGVFSEPKAKEIFHLFVAATYITPLIGAVLADGFFGKYPVIIGLSLFYCLGHGVLAFTEFPDLIEPQTALYAGLAFIALGAGGIKPCVSAHVGDQFGRRNVSMLEKVYGWFYVSINIGAFISQLMIPVVLKNYGSAWAFGIPGVLMAVALFVFWLGRHTYAHVPAGGVDTIQEIKSPEGRSIILRLLPLYLFVIAFWMIFDQTGGAWVIQADKMDLTVGPLTILPSQVQAVNPFYILFFVPLLSSVVFPALGSAVELTPLRKVGAGMFLTVVPFLITGWVETQISAGLKPSILWHLLAYAVLTLAEVLVSITVLEFSYTQAPKSWKSLIMGIYFLSVGTANLLVAQVNHSIEDSREAAEAARKVAREAGESEEAINAAGAQIELLAGASYYWFFAGVMAAAAVAFVLWSLTYRYRVGLDGMAPEEAVPLDSGRDGLAAAGDAPADPDAAT